MKWAEKRVLRHDRLPSTTIVQPTACSLQPAACGRARARGGFTLIEILVATSILMVIVLMVSMVFQQSNGAFQGGVRRVKDQTVLRGVLGTIARELVMAVDSDNYPDIPANNFAIKKISFVALTGAANEASGRRTPQLITFAESSGFVTRTVRNISYNGTKWSTGPASEAVKLNPDNKLSNFAFEITPGKGTLPLRVDIEARLITSGKDSLVSASSAGPDLQWDTKDDIVVGGR